MAYRAEIEIGVKGIKELGDFKKKLDTLANKVDNVNKKKLDIANLNTYGEALRKANETLGQTEIMLDKAGKATGFYKQNLDAYVTALLTSNNAQELNNRLIEDEIQIRRAATQALKTYNAETAASRQVGSMAGAYLRPGEASLRGQTSDASTSLALAQNRLNVERGIGEVQESLARLDNESIKAHNARLDLQTEYLLVLGRTADAASFRAQQSQQPLALPSSQMLAARDGSIQRIKTGEDLINESIRQGNVLRDRAVTADARRAEKIREQTRALTGVKNSLPEFEALVGQSSPISPVRTAEGARAATGFSVALPEISLDKEIEQRNKINSIIDDQITFNDKISDGLKKQRAVGLDINNLEKTDVKLIQQQGLLKQRELRTERKIQAAIKKNTEARRAQENALIGGAFPLLFGQGLGASAGGALGGFVGGKAGGQLGFGLSLVGTAVGQAFDDATKRVTEMGNALRTLDLSALESSAIRVSEELKFQVEKLKESGQFARARALIEQTVAKQTGSTATVIKDIANSGNLVKVAFDEVLASGSVLLGAVAAPFAALLAGILKTIAEIFKVINRIFAFVGGLLRQVQQIVDPGRNIQKAIERIAPAAAEATIEMKKFADELARSVGLAQQAANFDLKQAQFSLVDSPENKIDKRKNELARELNNIQLDINSKLKETAKLNAKDRAERVGAINLLQATLNRTAELNALRDIANIRIAEELRLNKENLRIEERRSQEVKERMAQADKELLAAIKANQAEAKVGSFVLPIATPFQGFTDEEIRQQELSKIQQEKRNRLQLLEKQNISELLKLDERRTIEAQANLAILQLSANSVNKQRQEDEARIKSIVEANTNLQNQIDLIKAKLTGTQDEVRLNQELDSIVKSIKGISSDEVEILRQKLVLLEQIKEAEEKFDIQQKTKFAGAGLQAGFIGEAGQAFEKSLIDGKSRGEAREMAQLTEQMVLAQTQAQALESAVLGIGDAFATAMTTGVSELIAGTKSAEEVFADFLKNIGDALISAAQQMIAQYIAIGIAKAFAGMGSGGFESAPLGADFGSPSGGFGGIGDFGLFTPGMGKANGGPVNAGRPYMVGERGPELFIPGSSGGIMRNEDMRQMMGRSPAGVGAPQMNFTFETTNIGGTEFVSREQLEVAMSTTRRQAASDGAKQGMSMTLDKMQNSPRTRSRVGIR